MAHRPCRTVSSLTALLVTLVSTAGCSSRTPDPYPTPPAPPRALTITAQRNQSQARQDKDKADCQSMASGQATSSESWAQIFTSCMGGRGYMVQ